MTFSSQQIEAITQSVLRELHARGVVSAAAVAARNTSDDTSAAPVAVLQQKVITEDTLAAADAAGHSLAIPAGAVITPSGHDYIRRHAVSISSGLPSASTATTGTLISVGDCTAASSAAAAANWTIVAAGCEFEAAAEAEQVTERHPVACCSRQPSIAACLVNRDSSIRAAVVTQNTDMNLLFSAMNPQVICLDSNGWTFTELRRLFRRISAVSRATPAGWKELTGGVR
ncbi:MAG: hypothetical protein GY758_13365 [Fuerstiella sp.]|nr:hypothetical protein [Fuerstiella sp.]MCP4505782.1 hypothetical protein [Fuerstiella sp.]MCP4784511.1 hypothetical protein [Fuerstiella sp.]MCP4854351.1 hypothetical protein [Fuerstiella sp.]